MKALLFIKNKINIKPESAIVLGSGLGDFTDFLENKYVFEFSEIPGYKLPTVKSHEGKLIFGSLRGRQIVCAKGRFHKYEGFKNNEITFSIQLFKALGCKNVLITNSSGCLRKRWNIGGFMYISSIMDFTFHNSINPIKIQINNSIDLKSIINLSSLENIDIYDGCYVWTLGPTYETPAEITEINQRVEMLLVCPHFLK